ncbi:flagellar motor switch protein FliN/FliY [Mobilisporobacter senegalensis]|uniref:Flagellar motor switch protein FliN/FliY n=1 Tax=Mobilisporobacter senegalensis TaxID=1329262 RepID=A0A3N1XW01_9FIRM|nr:flagellar motor switch phosphatase FliY [Mobilisporobacter senegalensis]ROR30776.1 flagellar motor switch protein FliN/FliY [Mobilisporobacter senegalensis]
MDGMLSQEEINALLNGVGSDEVIEPSDSNNNKSQTEDSLSVAEKDAIGEISNISMGTAATTLSTLVSQKVVITTPVVSYATLSDLTDDSDRPCVFVQISYKDGLAGNNILIIKEYDAKIITDLMMGGDGTNTSDELSELHLSALCEAMNQMMGSASTSISSMLEKRVDISPPQASLVDLNDTIDIKNINKFLEGTFVKVSFKMEIGDLVNSELMQLYPFDFARELYKNFAETHNKNMDRNKATNPTPAPSVDLTSQPMNQTMGQQGIPMGGQMPYGTPMGGQIPYGMPAMGGQIPYGGQMPYGMPSPDVNVQPAQFQAFSNNMNVFTQKENIDLIMDVPLEVTVELGRSNKSIKEILEFTPGTIIELNKLAGEPVDVLVNGKFVAKGEVVVIEESFGIRVTEIIKE